MPGARKRRQAEVGAAGRKPMAGGGGRPVPAAAGVLNN